MALTFDDVVDRAQKYGPEVPQATIVSFANARLGRMVAEADYRRKVASLGTTVSGTAAYNIASDVIDIRQAWIGSDLYERTSYDVVRDLVAGRRDLVGDGGVFAPYDDSSGVPQIVFYPTPSTTGDTITAEESYQSSDLTYGSAAATILPSHLMSYLADGVLADVYDYQAREDMADKYESRFEAGIDKLRRYKNSRVGSGPGRISLRGRWG
jgi:hypothetical protein